MQGSMILDSGMVKVMSINTCFYSKDDLFIGLNSTGKHTFSQLTGAFSRHMLLNERQFKVATLRYRKYLTLIQKVIS